MRAQQPAAGVGAGPQHDEPWHGNLGVALLDLRHDPLVLPRLRRRVRHLRSPLESSVVAPRHGSAPGPAGAQSHSPGAAGRARSPPSGGRRLRGSIPRSLHAPPRAARRATSRTSPRRPAGIRSRTWRAKSSSRPATPSAARRPAAVSRHSGRARVTGVRLPGDEAGLDQPLEVARERGGRDSEPLPELLEAHRPVPGQRLERRGLGDGHAAAAHVGPLGNAEAAHQTADGRSQPGGVRAGARPPSAA